VDAFSHCKPYHGVVLSVPPWVLYWSSKSKCACYPHFKICTSIQCKTPQRINCPNYTDR